MKVWDRAGIKLPTPESAVRLVSVARHVTHCATRPDTKVFVLHINMECMDKGDAICPPLDIM